MCDGSAGDADAGAPAAVGSAGCRPRDEATVTVRQGTAAEAKARGRRPEEATVTVRKGTAAEAKALWECDSAVAKMNSVVHFDTTDLSVQKTVPEPGRVLPSIPFCCLS